MQSATHQTLANLVEAHVTSLVRESAVVNRHSRRGGLLSAADDNNKSSSAAAAAANNSTNGGRQKRRRLIHHDDVNMALQWRGSEKLYVSGVSVPCVTPPDETDEGGSKQTKKSSSSSNNNNNNNNNNNKKPPKNALTQLLQNTTTDTTVASLLKATHVPRIDLNSYLQSELAIRPPSELAMTLHWLAVDGVSPMIPLNEVWYHTDTQERITIGGIDPLAPVLELDDDDDDDDENTNNNNKSKSEASIRIRELQQRLLSEELQLYFSRVTSIMEHSSNMIDIATILHGVRSDAGIQELVPFLSRFVASGLMNKKNLQNVDYCSRLIQLFDAMLDNPNLHLDLHLHQMFSPVGTCIVAKKLGNTTNNNHPMVVEDYHHHWALREAAARCLVKACDMYGMQYTTMKPRIIKLLTQQALRVDRPLATQYGGIVGISLFGPRAVDAFILPVAREYWEFWDEELEKLLLVNGNKRDVWREYELHMCQQALLDAVAIFMRGVTPGEQAKRVDIESFSDVFGERLIPMQPEFTEYVSAIV